MTFDSIGKGLPALQGVQRLFGEDGWVRLVFDGGEPPGTYARTIEQAHSLGLKVVGELLDSYEMRSMGVDAFKARVRSYVDALPQVDQWEVGNEVNGNWLGSSADVLAKVAYAAQYVKEHTSADTMLTLFWTLGEDDAAHSMFTWAKRNLGPVLPYVDDIGISLYPGHAPMGAAFDRVMTTLHRAFPDQRISVTELGYGTVGRDDQGSLWWWHSPTDRSPTGPAAAEVASLYQSAVMDYDFAGGGAYWWYYLQTVKEGNSLWNALSSAHSDAIA